MAYFPVRMASGKTAPTNWIAYGANGIYVDVNTTSGGFVQPPAYITSIGGNGNHWATTGATSIYSPTATGFRIYVRWVDGGPLTPSVAQGYGWFINWIGMEF
jgi:hypothetical protein